MKRPRVAIVGCGRMGRTRFHAATRHGAEIVALVDPDLARAEAFAPGPDTLLLVDPLRIPYNRLDAIFVCTPPSERGPVELQAIASGIALFVEKPIGLTAGHILPVVEALRGRPVVTAVGYMNRYRRSVQKALDLTRRGPIIGFSANWLGRPYMVPWWGNAAGSGGPVNEQATHLIDLSRFLVGELAEVHALACASAASPDLSETAVVSLRFRDGGLGSLLYSCGVEEKMIELRLFSRHDEIRLEGWDFRFRGENAGGPPQTRDDPVFFDETAAFLDAVTNVSNDAILSDFLDAYRTQQAVDAIHAALRSGKTETVP